MTGRVDVDGCPAKDCARLVEALAREAVAAEDAHSAVCGRPDVSRAEKDRLGDAAVTAARAYDAAVEDPRAVLDALGLAAPETPA